MTREKKMYRKKTLSTLRNKCEHLIGRILVYLAPLRSHKGGTK